MDISIDYSVSLAALLGRFERLPAAVEDELVIGVTEASFLLQREVVELTPTSGAGTLRDSIGALPVRIDGVRVVGAVASASLYVQPVELGTKPHHPPLAPLLDWVQRKLGLRDEEADEAARKIAWKIAAHGSKGVFMFKRAFEATEAQIAEIIIAAAQRGLAAEEAGA